MKSSKERFGYASSPEPETLQEQVEALEDAKIPTDHQFADIVNPSHPVRIQFETLLGCAQAGDVIAVATLSALGNDILDAYKRAKVIEDRDLILEVLTLSPWDSQKEMIDAFCYFSNLFQIQKNLIPSAGKPLKPYPLGWRNAYRRYMDGESTAQEICNELDIKTYDFYRMAKRYNVDIKKRKSKKTKKPRF